MSSGNLLVVISGRPDPGALRSQLREAVTPDMQVRVVASPSVSSLEWLTNDEDASRGEAQELADLAADVMLQRPEREPEVGESDTVQAVEDALRTFPADQVLVVLAGEDEGAGQDLMRKLAGLGLPLRTLEVPSRPD